MEETHGTEWARPSVVAFGVTQMRVTWARPWQSLYLGAHHKRWAITERQVDSSSDLPEVGG